MVVFQYCLVQAPGGNLVGDPPEADGSMMVVLDDQFLHLLQCIFPPVLHMPGDIRDLCPYHHAVFIAEVIKILVMLIMCQPDAVGPQFGDQLHILPVHFPGQRVADPFPVLMAGDAPQGIGLSVQEKSLFRVYRKTAASKTEPDLILEFPVQQELCLCRIQIGVFPAIP